MTLNMSTRTMQDVLRAVKRQFGDESGVQITDEDILRWTNDGQREINTKNKIIKAKATGNFTPGQADYPLPIEDAAEIISIHVQDVPITALTYPEAQQYIMSKVSENATGIPTLWYMFAGVMTFWPRPSSDLRFSVLYVQNPTQVVTTTSPLGIPDKYYNTLIQYVLAQAYEMDEDWDASTYKAQQFSQTLDLMADEETTGTSLVYPTITVVDYY